MQNDLEMKLITIVIFAATTTFAQTRAPQIFVLESP